MFTEIKVNDIPKKNNKKTGVYADEIRAFIESGMEAAEVNIENMEEVNKIYMRYKVNADRIGGVNVIRRKSKVYLIRIDNASESNAKD